MFGIDAHIHVLWEMAESRRDRDAAPGQSRVQPKLVDKPSLQPGSASETAMAIGQVRDLAQALRELRMASSRLKCLLMASYLGNESPPDKGRGHALVPHGCIPDKFSNFYLPLLDELARRIDELEDGLNDALEQETPVSLEQAEGCLAQMGTGINELLRQRAADRVRERLARPYPREQDVVADFSLAYVRASTCARAAAESELPLSS